MNSRILPTLALIIAVALFFVYVQPTWSGSIKNMKATITSDNQALEAATAYARQQNQLATARNAIDPANLARLVTFLPDSVGNVGLILDLNALAARSGLSLSNIDVTTNTAASANASLSKKAADPIGSADLSISAVGTYTALKTFLIGVERSERLLDVQDIVIKGSNTGVYTYNLRIHFYWLR